MLGGAVSLVVTYHDTENRPKGGICVANHTTPIDIMTLACDNAYALTGQRHGGFNGYFQVGVLQCLTRTTKLMGVTTVFTVFTTSRTS